MHRLSTGQDSIVLWRLIGSRDAASAGHGVRSPTPCRGNTGWAHRKGHASRRQRGLRRCLSSDGSRWLALAGGCCLIRIRSAEGRQRARHQLLAHRLERGQRWRQGHAEADTCMQSLEISSSIMTRPRSTMLWCNATVNELSSTHAQDCTDQSRAVDRATPELPMPSTACGGDLTRRPLAALSPSPFCRRNTTSVSKRTLQSRTKSRASCNHGCARRARAGEHATDVRSTQFTAKAEVVEV